MLAGAAGPSSAASSDCRFSVWRVIAKTLTMRDAPGSSRVVATIHYNDQFSGPIGQGGRTWIYGTGLHRHGSPWTGTGVKGYVLRSYLDYECTQC
jgi:hypothetical protein